MLCRIVFCLADFMFSVYFGFKLTYWVLCALRSCLLLQNKACLPFRLLWSPLPQSSSSADSLVMQLRTCINICLGYKSPAPAATPLSEHTKTLHALTGTGCPNTQKHCTHWQERVALLSWLLRLTQKRRPEFTTRDKETCTRNKKEKEKKKKKKKKGKNCLTSAAVTSQSQRWC